MRVKFRRADCVMYALRGRRYTGPHGLSVELKPNLNPSPHLSWKPTSSACVSLNTLMRDFFIEALVESKDPSVSDKLEAAHGPMLPLSKDKPFSNVAANRR